jgi:hypothetical protein
LITANGTANGSLIANAESVAVGGSHYRRIHICWLQKSMKHDLSDFLIWA